MENRPGLRLNQHVSAIRKMFRKLLNEGDEIARILEPKTWLKIVRPSKVSDAAFWGRVPLPLGDQNLVYINSKDLPLDCKQLEKSLQEDCAI